MLPLFVDWARIGRRLRAAPTIALFLDFDGTLARLEDQPEQVSLDGCVRHALATLGRSSRFRVWIVSGRRQADIRARVGVPGIRYLGLHGWEGRAGASLPEESESRLAAVLTCLNRRLAAIPGIWIEDKTHALAIHYRAAEAAGVSRARAIVDDVIAPHALRLRLQPGKSVWEILPSELEDKGAAVQRELAALGREALPIYVGDDEGDEPAFATLARGITIRVGTNPASRARYRLTGVRQVRAFLDRLIAEIA
jgi:trehalose 6-phosphate phosphatase